MPLRTLLAGALAAVALVALPASAGAATPRGALAESEYQVLLAAYDRGAALGADATPAQMRAVCAAVTPRSTRLLAADHAACMGFVRWMDAGTRFGKVERLCGSDPDCFARELRRLETATRAVSRLVRAERRVVAARGLPATCARAFAGSEVLTLFDGMARALKDMRVAMLAGDVRGVDRAGRRLQRVAAEADGTSPSATVELLRRCPRA